MDEFWLQKRVEYNEHYPMQRGKFRGDIELYNPCLFMKDVPVDHYAHHPPYRYYYCCDEWSSIFPVYERNNKLRFLFESNNPEPIQGERLLLFSTSSSIWNEPWGRNKSNVYAFFRNKIWGCSHIEFFGEWKFCISFPLSNRFFPSVFPEDDENSHTQEDFLPPTEGNQDVVLSELIKERKPIRYLLCADYFEDKLYDYGFADYIRCCYNAIDCYDKNFYRHTINYAKVFDYPVDYYYGKSSDSIRDIKRFIVEQLQFYGNKDFHVPPLPTEWPLFVND